MHRHSLGGFAVYTRTEKPGLPETVKLATLLKDHLGSTDVILTGTWDGSSFASDVQTERQSFDPWGERRDPGTFVNYRQTDTDAYRTSANDYDRGYTGHEQLDDSGLIHMNGRIYDPELGRMLSPDPFVQVPEYSQNFNRYSYVLNNPLNATDPTGYSWLSDAFHSIGHWFKENWRTVLCIVVAAVAFCVFGPGAFGFAGMGLQGAQLGIAVGATTGAFNAAINGGNFGDVLKGAAIGAIQGAITGGILHGMEGAAEQSGLWLDKAVHIAGHGVVGGASNVVMGGKFQDGFLSAAAGAYAGWTIMKNSLVAGTIGSSAAGRSAVAGVVGGTASVIGGGKFANGAWTAVFQHYLNFEANWKKLSAMEKLTATASAEVYDDHSGGLLSELGIPYEDSEGFGATLTKTRGGYILAFRGTQMKSGADWWANLAQGVGLTPSQYKQAAALARSVSSKLGGDVTLAGHSLGGGLAAYAAMENTLAAYTFNAAGVHMANRGFFGLHSIGTEKYIFNNSIRGEVLTTIQNATSATPHTVGSIKYLDGRGDPVARHGMEQFLP